MLDMSHPKWNLQVPTPKKERNKKFCLSSGYNKTKIWSDSFIPNKSKVVLWRSNSNKKIKNIKKDLSRSGKK